MLKMDSDSDSSSTNSFESTEVREETRKGSQIFALTWVKQKAAKQNPDRVVLSEDELKTIFNNKKSSKNESQNHGSNEGNSEGANKESQCSKDGDNQDDDDDLKEFNLDEYDDEDNVGMDDLENLCVFASNESDPYMTKKRILDEDEMSDDAINLVDSDNMLVCARCEKDYAQLDIYVYNNQSQDFFIHHYIPLPDAPLCLQWLDFHPKGDEGHGNFVAVGNLDSTITAWDLDVLHEIEPAFTLGVPQRKHRKLLKSGRKNFGHRDAVLDLSWSPITRSQLASASADHLVAIWDLEKSKISRKFRDNADKVQTLEWNPQSATNLLSGAFDGRIYNFDTRAPSGGSRSRWKIKGEVERVAWNQENNDYFAASTSKGTIFYYDVRTTGKSLFHFTAHEQAVPSLTMTSASCLYSGSSDGSLKVWEIEGQSAKLISSKDMGMGMIHCMQMNPDCGDLFAVGGEKNGLKLWNKQTGKQRFPNEIPDEDEEADLSSKRPKLERKTMNRRAKTEHFSAKFNKKKTLKNNSFSKRSFK